MRLSGCGVVGARGGGGGGGAAERIPGGGGGGIDAERGNTGAADGDARRALPMISADTAVREGAASGAALLFGAALLLGAASTVARFAAAGAALGAALLLGAGSTALGLGAGTALLFGAGSTAARLEAGALLFAAGALFELAFDADLASAFAGVFEALALVAVRDVEVAIGARL